MNALSRLDWQIDISYFGTMRCEGSTDYEALLQQARAARRQDGERLKRVMRLSKKGKLLQERGLLRAHKEVWEKERARLLTDKNEV